MEYGDPMRYMEDTFIDNPTDKTLRRSLITVTGCAAKPTVTINDRGDHPASSVQEQYAGGTLTLAVMHNGPVDISIKCAGNNPDRLDAPTFAAVESVPQPDMAAPVTADVLAYDFEDMAEGDALTPTTQPWMAADGAGAAVITRFDGSLTLNPAAIGTGTNRVGVANLTRFGAEQDYAVTWKELTTQVSKGGILMRGVYPEGGANPGLMDGYYFQASTDLAAGKTSMSIRKVVNNADGTTLFDNGEQGEATIAAPEAGRPRWYRATCKNNLLTFEYSDDGLTFTRVATRVDNDYRDSGITQPAMGRGRAAGKHHVLRRHKPHLSLGHRHHGHRRHYGRACADRRRRRVVHPARRAHSAPHGTRRVHQGRTQVCGKVNTHPKPLPKGGAYGRFVSMFNVSSA